MYCTTSFRLAPAAASKTLESAPEPTNNVRYPSRSDSTVCFRCSFLTLSTARILLSWSSVIVLALTAPSQGIGRWRMLFTNENRYVGGSRDMAAVTTKLYSRMGIRESCRGAEVVTMGGFEVLTGNYVWKGSSYRGSRICISATVLQYSTLYNSLIAAPP